MKRILIIATICWATPWLVNAQTSKKIKVVLMGVTHFANPNQDIINARGDDMLSPKRQKDIESLTKQLAAFGFDKVFVEATPDQQPRFDSLYRLDLKNQLLKEADERRQVGFRLASELKHEKVFCVDAPGQFDFDAVMKYANENGQASFIQKNLGLAQKYVASLDSILLSSTLTGFIRYLNRPDQLWYSHSFYNNILALVGDDKRTPGPDLVGEWYKRNVRIYSSIVRRASADDKKLFILFGQGHIYLIKQLFEANPDFEVVELNSILRDR